MAMHDLLVFAGGAIASQIVAVALSLIMSARRRRSIADRLGPPAP
ncbi:hypothetical protein [Komagataeibacter xylinus]|nr:hypothetical protein [Komagataeibacter xylinus]